MNIGSYNAILIFTTIALTITSITAFDYLEERVKVMLGAVIFLSTLLIIRLTKEEIKEELKRDKQIKKRIK